MPRKSQFTYEQNIRAVREVDAGAKPDRRAMRALTTLGLLATACGGGSSPPDAAPAAAIDAPAVAIDAAAAPPDASPCDFAITPTTRAFTTLGAAADPNSVCGPHTNTAAIVATTGCAWSAVASPGDGPDGWLTVVSGGGPNVGTGAGQALQFRAEANRHGATARTGTITVLDGAGTPTGAVLTVSQIADPAHACP